MSSPFIQSWSQFMENSPKTSSKIYKNFFHKLNIFSIVLKVFSKSKSSCFRFKIKIVSTFCFLENSSKLAQNISLTYVPQMLQKVLKNRQKWFKLNCVSPNFSIFPKIVLIVLSFFYLKFFYKICSGFLKFVQI